MSGRRRPRRRLPRALLALTVLGAGTATVVHLLNPPAATVPGTCTVTDDLKQSYTVDIDQARYAATIAGVGLKLGLPDHAVTIALATAMQESKLENLDYGDRDSLGLFQQRPSQGWGKPAQLLDPTYAATAFYQHLAKVPGWRTMAVTVAAQAVQNSGAPDAYAFWENEARAYAIALTGEHGADLTCKNLAMPLKPTANLASAAAYELGTRTITGEHPIQQGWAMSAWLVGQSTRFGLEQVCFLGRCWTAKSGAWNVNASVPAGLSYVMASAA